MNTCASVYAFHWAEQMWLRSTWLLTGEPGTLRSLVNQLGWYAGKIRQVLEEEVRGHRQGTRPRS